jgi:hypothetical protein
MITLIKLLFYIYIVQVQIPFRLNYEEFRSQMCILRMLFLHTKRHPFYYCSLLLAVIQGKYLPNWHMLGSQENRNCL